MAMRVRSERQRLISDRKALQHSVLYRMTCAAAAEVSVWPDPSERLMTVWIFFRRPRKAVPELSAASGTGAAGGAMVEKRPAQSQSGRPQQIRGRWAEGRPG